MTIESGMGSSEKVIGIICIVIVFSAFAGLPFMIIDKENRREALWQEKGCQMYDEKSLDSVPSKCRNDFVDHYKPQVQRDQP